MRRLPAWPPSCPAARAFPPAGFLRRRGQVSGRIQLRNPGSWDSSAGTPGLKNWSGHVPAALTPQGPGHSGPCQASDRPQLKPAEAKRKGTQCFLGPRSQAKGMQQNQAQGSDCGDRGAVRAAPRPAVSWGGLAPGSCFLQGTPAGPRALQGRGVALTDGEMQLPGYTVFPAWTVVPSTPGGWFQVPLGYQNPRRLSPLYRVAKDLHRPCAGVLECSTGSCWVNAAIVLLLRE